MTKEEITPFIFKRERTIAPNGELFEDKQLTVQGVNLKECERIFKEQWNKKTKGG